METTINVTKPALEKLQQVLQGKDEVPGIRVYEAGGSCGGASFALAADDPTEADEVVDVDGVQVFAGKLLLQQHGGITVDYTRADGQEGFVVTPAKVQTKGMQCGNCRC